MKRKPKDVTPRKKARGRGAAKNSASFYPKIFEMAATTGSLQLQRVRCGKPNCKCARGEPHAAYYFCWSTSVGTFKRYVRRADVPLLRAVIERRKRRDAAFRAEMRQSQDYLRRLLASVGLERL